MKVNEEKMIPLREVPALPWIPRRRNGRPVKYAAVYAWVWSGRRGVKLRVEIRGGLICTRESWLKSFFRKVTAARAAKLEMKARA